MDSNLEHQVRVVVGLFVISCLASAFIYGSYPIIVCVIGLFVIAVVLQAFRDGMGGR